MLRFAEEIVDWMLPAIPATMDWLASDFRIEAVSVFTDHGSARVGILAVLSRSLVEAGRAVIAGETTPILLTVTVGGVLQPVWMALIAAAAWPGRAAEFALRLPLVLPAAALPMLLDTPVSFATRLWDTQLSTLHIPHHSPLIWWVAFLEGGGRLVLGLVAGAVAVAAARALTSPRTPLVDT
jgi:hypothetical protein